MRVMIAILTAALMSADLQCAAAFERLRAEGAVEAAFVHHVAFVRGDAGDGEARWFLIDTGANRSALDQGVARKLNLPVLEQTRVEGTAGVIEASTTRLETLTVGGVTAALSPTVSDLSGLQGPNGQPVAGILGSDLMGERVVSLDFERNTLALSASRADVETAARCGRTVSFENDNGIPRLNAELDGREVMLRYDSGAGIFESPHLWVNLSQRQFDVIRGDRPAGEPITTLGGSGTGGSVTLPVHTGESLSLGQLSWRQPRLIIQPPQGYFAREDAVGFIGNAAFWPMGLLIVDYPGGRLIAAPAPISAGGSSPEDRSE
jgi:predicted aspartyl protease